MSVPIKIPAPRGHFLTPIEAERFWKKVDDSGGPDACWPWKAGHFSTGDGAFTCRGTIMRTRVIAWRDSGQEYEKHEHLLLQEGCVKDCNNPTHMTRKARKMGKPGSWSASAAEGGGVLPWAQGGRSAAPGARERRARKQGDRYGYGDCCTRAGERVRRPRQRAGCGPR